MNIYVDANWNGTDAAPEGFDKIYNNLTDAIKNAATDQETIITLAAGTYDDNVAFFGKDLSESELTYLDAGKKAVYNQAKFITEQKGAIKIVAQEANTVTLTGSMLLGYYRKGGREEQKWNNTITFENITFDQANDATHSLYVDSVGNGTTGLELNKCTFIGDGEYGIGSPGGNNTDKSSITNCTFNNGGLQIYGNFGTNLSIKDCTLNESCINVGGGNSVTIDNCEFNNTLTDANVGDSFYCIRSNDTPINVINSTVINIDSKLKSVATDQAKWAILWQRGAGNTNWTVFDLEINLTEAAAKQTELLVNKNATTSAEKVADRIVINSITSNQNITDLLERSEGILNVNTAGKFYILSDGEITKEITLDTVYVDSDLKANDVENNKLLGVNTFNTAKDAFAAIKANNSGTINLGTEEFVSANSLTSDADAVTITTAGTYTLTGGNGYLFNYEIEVNPEKDAGNFEFNIDDAYLTMSKVTFRDNVNATISNSRLDQHYFGGTGYLSVYGNSTLEITDSVVGFNKDATKFDSPDQLTEDMVADNSRNWGYTFVIYGKVNVTNSDMYLYVGQSVQAGFDVLGDAQVTLTNSNIDMAVLQIGTAYETKKLSSTAKADLEGNKTLIATVTINGGSLSDSQYRGDYVTKSGIIIGSLDGKTAGKLIVENNVVIDITNQTNDNRNAGVQINNVDSSISISNSEFYANTITNNGTILIDGQSILKADTLTLGENAIIKIDATNFTGFKKIIDLTNGTSLEGKVEIIGEDKLAQNVIYGEDGDITLVNIDTNTIYVSEDFTGNLGDEVGGENSGKYLGYNAFSVANPWDVADAIRAASADANVSKVVVDANSTTEVYSHAVNYNITTQNANGLIIDLGKHATDSEVYSSLLFGGETTTIGEKVQVIADGLAASTGCTSIKGALDINEAFIFAGGEVSVAGQLNVNNDFTLSGTYGSTDKLTVEKDGQFTATNLVVEGTNFEVNINGQANIQNLGANSIVNVGETGSLNTTTNNGTLNVTGTISGKEVTNNNIINVTSSTAKIDTAITGNGIFAVKDGAEFTTSKDITNGSVFVGYDYETEKDTAGSTLTVAKNTTLKATGEEGVINVRANSKLITNGDVVANYFRATGDIEINGLFALEGSSSSVIKKGATVVVNGQLINQYTQDANGVVTSYPVNIENAGTLDVNGKISLAGKVDDYDSVIANSGVININKNANIDAQITGNGTIYVKDGAKFTNTKDIAANALYVGYNGEATTAASSLTIAKDTNVVLNGDNAIFSVATKSSVTVLGTLNATKVNIATGATITVDNAKISGNIDNYGKVIIKGKSVTNLTVKSMDANSSVEIANNTELSGTLTADVLLKGNISIIGNGMINGAITGNKNITLKSGENATDKVGINFKGASKINNITITGKIVFLGTSNYVKTITVDGSATMMLSLFAPNALGTSEIKGKNNAQLTASANDFGGNKVSNVALTLTNVDLNNGVNLNIDNLANIKSINGATITGNATAGYTFHIANKGSYKVTEVNNQLIFTLISETETVTRENITGSLNNLVTGNDIIVSKEGTANLTLSKNEAAKVAAILKNENGSKTNLTIDKNAQLTVANDVEAINKLTTKEEATLTIEGTLTGTHKNTNISIGKKNTINVGSIDLMGGKNTLSIASGAEVNITDSDLVDATTIKLANGIAANAKKGTPEDKTVLDIAGNIENSGAKNTITLGNFAELNVDGELDNSDLNVGTTIKAGKNSTITFGGAMKSVASINLGEASELSAQSIIGTVGNDKFVFGKNSVVNVGGIDMKGGKNTFQASANAEVNINGSLDNVTTVKVDKNATLDIVGNVSGVNSNITLGQNATLYANGNITSVNKLTLGKEAILKAQDIVGTDKKDTLSISANAKLIVTSINDIESINIAKGGLLILQNGNADINLDSIKGSWKNGTIYDYQYNITNEFNGNSLVLEGSVYKNEFDCYQFMVEDGGISQIAFDSDLTGINLSLWMKIDDQWTKIDYFKGTGSSTPIYDSSILSAGNYLIMVSKENADLLKDNANDDNTYSITITK